MLSAALSGPHPWASSKENQADHGFCKKLNILRFGERWVLGDLGIVQWSDLNEEFTSAATIDDPLMMSTREVMSTRLESRGTRC